MIAPEETTAGPAAPLATVIGVVPEEVELPVIRVTAVPVTEEVPLVMVTASV